MPDFILVPRWPERRALVRFFAERRALDVKEAADLLGWLWPKLLFEAREDGTLLPHDRVAWREVAYWLLQVWPRAWLLETLGEYATVIPPELHLRPVNWRLPIYLVRALERQVDLQRRDDDTVHGTAVEDYVAELLHVALEDETVATFHDDRAFREAYDWPYGSADEEQEGSTA